MPVPRALCLVVSGSILALAAHAQEAGLTRPSMVLKQVIEGMPTTGQQEVTVLTAAFKPGDKTVFHTHRFPVTVYVLEGAFTLEMEDRPAVTVKAGGAFIEPPHVRMTGYNRSVTEPARVLIFYVGDPGAPFLDAAH